MDGNYSDDEREGEKAGLRARSLESCTRPFLIACPQPNPADVNEYDAPIVKRQRVASAQEVQRSRAAGEALDRDSVRELLGACTDTHTRQPARPQLCRPFGDTFSTLAGVLVATQASVVTVETPSLHRHCGTLSGVRRDLSLLVTAQQQRASPVPSAPAAPPLYLPGIDVACVHLPRGTHVASELLRYVKHPGNALFKPKRGKSAGKGGRAAAAEHAPIGLSGR